MIKTPEQKARDNIDKMLERSGWAVVDKNAIDWRLGPTLAVREYQTDEIYRGTDGVAAHDQGTYRQFRAY